MWALENKTQYPAERFWVRDSKGAEVWVVVVKATYDIKNDGTTAPSEQQKPICKTAQYMGEPGKSSLLYDTDLNLTKKTTDIYLHAHAYAPQGKSVTELEAGFRVGPMKKILYITGSRYWFKFGPFYDLNKPTPFTKMPIVYERAFGGVDIASADTKKQGVEYRNPIGCGFGLEKKNLLDKRAPNILYRGKKYPDNDAKIPAGFGPIAPEWMPRKQMAGTYDENWNKHRSPLLPVDFDEQFYQCAPLDQQAPEYLMGGEEVILVNLTPEGKLEFSLPKLRLAFNTKFTNKSIEHRAKLHTVIIEPDERQVQMVWHTSLQCHHDVNRLQNTRITEKQYIDLSSRK